MKNMEAIHEYCLSKQGVEEDFPFDEDTLVFKVGGKIFLLMNLEKTPTFVNLKCVPEMAEELRARYPAVKPGYHMSKRHWNSVYLDGHFSDEELRSWIDNSYELVVQKLTKATRQELGLS